MKIITEEGEIDCSEKQHIKLVFDDGRRISASPKTIYDAFIEYCKGKEFSGNANLLLAFSTEEKCIAYFEQMRWGGSITCPHCGHGKVYRTNIGFKCASDKCHKKFTVKVGTVFEGSNIKLQKWLKAIYILTAHKKSVSSCQLARDLGVSQKTGWFMLHRIREMFMDKAPELIAR